MTSTPTSTRRSPSTRRWWVVGIVGVLAMSTLAVWWGLSATIGRVHWVNTGHEVVSDELVQVRFDLHRPVGRDVTCVLRAQDQYHATVGRTEVEVPAADVEGTRQVGEVRTSTRALTGFVDTCRYSD